MDQETDQKEQCIVQFIVGDLLWAKIGSYPYWPCMISYDPYEGCYYKKKKIRTKEVVIYHVQYFGKQVQHGWTSPGLIIPFKGEAAFLAEKAELKKAAKSSSSQRKIASRYEVPSGYHEAWTIAIQEAEGARELDVEERYESYVFKYDFNIKKNVSKSGRSVLQRSSTKKRKSKGNSNKSKKAQELYGTDKRICKVCGLGHIDLICSGTCFQYFHKDCLGLLKAPEDFKCAHCVQGLYTCFVCKKTGASTIICSKCKYHYHKECLTRYPGMDPVRNLCPYHVCLTCHNQNLEKKRKGYFVSCVRCPTSFHASPLCIPVGSVKLSSDAIICPDHFLGKDKVSPQVTSNVSYCAVCSEGGELICCESCPSSYHATCINTEEIPMGDFFCEDCTKRQFLYVGMIVWAKTGNFRWWPAQIVDVDELPLNVKNMENYDGEFPIQYFGTDEYFWTNRGRVIPYGDHNKDYFRKGSKNCRLENSFRISLEEAVEAFNQYVTLQTEHAMILERGAYKHIKVNRPVPPAQIANLSGKSVLPCSCNPNRPYPCGEGSGCLNRSMLMECHPGVCLAGDRCENQKFQRRTYAKVKVFKTASRGWGLLADQFIPRGTFVIEYVGEVITHEEYRNRVIKMQEMEKQNYYFLYLDSRRMIDAGPQGNLSRFINHSCSANCEMSKWSVNGDSRIGIFSIRDIKHGEELTFNYQSDTIQFMQKCNCGSSNCQGYIGRNGEKHRKKIKAK